MKLKDQNYLTGKLVLRYVGEHGRHSELYVSDELVAAGFNCNKSIMLLIWCACDNENLHIDEYLYADFIYEHQTLGADISKKLFKPELFSKYDILMTKNAAATAYYDIVYKKKYTINQLLSARQDIFLHVQKKYKLNNLEVEYELDEQEIWDNGKVN